MDEFDVLREYLQDKHGGTGVTHHTAKPSAFTRLENREISVLWQGCLDEANALITVGGVNNGNVLVSP